MTMRAAYHGTLFLILAMVMAVLSTGICTALVLAPAPAPSSKEFPATKFTCVKILSNSDCDRGVCHDLCFTRFKGNGVCLRDHCWCSYTDNCKSSLVPPTPSPSW